MKRRRFIRSIGLGGLLTVCGGWMSKTVAAPAKAKTKHIKEDWSNWLIPPNFRHNDPLDADTELDFRWKLVGPGALKDGAKSYRSGFRMKQGMTVQESADCFIQFGEYLHAFVAEHEGGKK